MIGIQIAGIKAKIDSSADITEQTVSDNQCPALFETFDMVLHIFEESHVGFVIADFV